MQKSSIKYWKPNSTVYQKDHMPQSSQFHPSDAGIVEHMQIIKCNTTYLQKQKPKPNIISVDAEKAFDKIQHHFMIKIL
jgi:hypothetical protein